MAYAPECQDPKAQGGHNPAKAEEYGEHTAGQMPVGAHPQKKAAKRSGTRARPSEGKRLVGGTNSQLSASPRRGQHPRTRKSGYGRRPKTKKKP